MARGSERARLGILLSGRGSNFVALADAVERGEVPAEIALVVSNVAEAPGLQKARERGLPAAAIPQGDFSCREAHDGAMLQALRAARVEWVCLAGYMRLLSPSFIAAYRGRILNVHPSLLPAFPGLAAQRQALEHGVKVSGCTVHFVDEGLDSGPIVVQKAVPVADGDTAETLAARILDREHEAYPLALQRLLTESWRLEGRRLVFGAKKIGERG